MLLRVVLFILLVWLVIHVARKLLTKPRAPDRLKAPARMLKCDVCGLHVPEGEAIQADGRNYCSPEHRDSNRQD